MSKYIEADWVQATIAKARVSGWTWARVACTWHQTQTATGRLSSSSPNLQVCGPGTKCVGKCTVLEMSCSAPTTETYVSIPHFDYLKALFHPFRPSGSDQVLHLSPSYGVHSRQHRSLCHQHPQCLHRSPRLRPHQCRLLPDRVEGTRPHEPGCKTDAPPEAGRGQGGCVQPDRSVLPGHQEDG